LTRFHGTFLSAFLLLFALACWSIGQDKNSAAKKKPDAAASDSTKKTGEAGTALSPELTHRIVTELRSRYNVPPSVSVTLSNPKAGNTPGFDDVVVTFSGAGHSTNHDFLVSKDRKTLAHLETIDISQDLMSKIDVKGRPIKGNPNAKVTIVNYDDFQCPFCSRMHAAFFADVFKDYADRVRVIYKDYPLIEMHSWAMRAAVDGNCLGEQNNQAYWDFADVIHANQKSIAGKSRSDAFANLDNAAKDQAQKHQLDENKLMACVQKQDESAVRASMAEGDKLGVDSTPTFFINGERFSGVIGEQELRAVLDRALTDAGEQAPASAKK